MKWKAKKKIVKKKKLQTIKQILLVWDNTENSINQSRLNNIRWYKL